MSGIMQLSPSETFEFVTNALACRQVPYIAGPPAIGKSQVVHQVADAANAEMIDIRLSQYLSEDLTGLPERDEKTGKAKYLPFDVFPLVGDKIPDGKSGWIIFLDELSSATEEVLAAAYSLILDRMVGGKKLHDKCLVVAAGNRASDSAIARELPDTLITRMLPAEMKVSTKDWLRWADPDHNKQANDHVVSFIEKNPTMLYAPTKAKDRAELETYATPRGWEKVFTHMNLHEKRAKIEKTDQAGLPTGEMGSAPISEPIFAMMAAAVGSMAARTFREEYDESIQLPYPWEVAQSPASTRIPPTGVGKAKMITELSKYFIEADGQSRDSVLSYINRISGEYSELFLKQIRDQLGSTASDQRLIEQTGKRLSIDPLLGTAPKGGDPDDNNVPF